MLPYELPMMIDIDVMQPENLVEALQIANSEQFNAIIVPPENTVQAIIAKSRSRSDVELLIGIDWQCQRKGADKFRGIPREALEADGYQVVISIDDSSYIPTEILNITDFVDNHIGRSKKLAFVLQSTKQESLVYSAIDSIISMSKFPRMVRIDNSTRGIATKKAIANITTKLQSIRSSGLAIGLSGYSESLEVMAGLCINCPNVVRFAASIAQARSLVTQMNNDGLTKSFEAYKNG